MGRLSASILLLVLVMMPFLTAVLPATGKSTTEIMIDVDAFEISDLNGYTPAVARVIIGVNNTVRWTNADGTEHTVVSLDGLFRSGFVGPGASFNYTFNSPGTFKYHCILHSWMVGTVIVNSGSPIASITSTAITSSTSSRGQTTATITSTTSSTSSRGQTTATISTPSSGFPTTSVALVLLLVGLALVLATIRRTRSK